jgi:hypothetical protein
MVAARALSVEVIRRTLWRIISRVLEGQHQPKRPLFFNLFRDISTSSWLRLLTGTS